MIITETVDILISEDKNKVQELVNKYSEILVFTKSEKKLPYLAYVIDVAVNHIESTLKTTTQDWKTWAVILIRNMFISNGIETTDEITTIIDEFLSFVESDYGEYYEKIIASDDFKKEKGFVGMYMRKKNL